MLTQKRKSSVFRLQVDGWSRDTVIAKLCSGSYGTAADIEGRIYREVLPAAGLPSVELFGRVPEPDGPSVWLFMEDLGEALFASSTPEGRRLLARWLATLHQWKSTAHAIADLPDRGPAGYLEHLHAARRRICDNLHQPWIDDVHRATLTRLVRLLDRLESNWPRVEAICGLCPRTIVHGDLVMKNVRLRSRGGADELVEFYVSSMRSAWPDMSVAFANALAAVGRIFRSLAVLDWKTWDLENDWCAAEAFDSFEGRFDAAVRSVESRDGGADSPWPS